MGRGRHARPAATFNRPEALSSLIHSLAEIAEQNNYRETDRSMKLEAPILEPPDSRRDDFIDGHNLRFARATAAAIGRFLLRGAFKSGGD